MSIKDLKQKQLNKIALEIATCIICQENKTGKPVAGEGNPDSDIVFLGEAPGKTEAQTGIPFIGRSGKLLRSLIKQVGLNDEDVYITSPVKYLPNHGTPTPAEIAHGKTHLLKQLAIIEPKVVVLLGATAAKAMLTQKVAVAKDHGRLFKQNDISYFLTYHPAAAIRFQKNHAPLQSDFQKLKVMIGNAYF